jgi:predicted aspartyl protease
MGHVRVRIKLANAERREDGVEVEEALVDTGATWTTIPRALAEELGLHVIGQMAVKTAAGPQQLDQSYAYVELADKRMVTPLLVSDTLETVLIGVTTLEALGLAVDPATGQLKESEVLLLAACATAVPAALREAKAVGRVVRREGGRASSCG